MVTSQEIYGTKLSTTFQTNYEYPIAYVVKDEGWITLRGSLLKMIRETIRRETKGVLPIMKAKNNSRGCFEDNNDHFYFFTYTNTSDFACGYYDANDTIDYSNVSQDTINKNEESPLEFIDEVEIEYIKFIYNYKYAYYKINNKLNGKAYYGIIVTKNNLVVFNTDVEICILINLIN